jgi:hypothetical protein
MPWWVVELVTNIVLVALAVVLGPFIKRFASTRPMTGRQRGPISTSTRWREWAGSC